MTATPQATTSDKWPASKIIGLIAAIGLMFTGILTMAGSDTAMNVGSVFSVILLVCGALNAARRRQHSDAGRPTGPARTAMTGDQG